MITDAIIAEGLRLDANCREAEEKCKRELLVDVAQIEFNQLRDFAVTHIAAALREVQRLRNVEKEADAYREALKRIRGYKLPDTDSEAYHAFMVINEIADDVLESNND